MMSYTINIQYRHQYTSKFQIRTNLLGCCERTERKSVIFMHIIVLSVQLALKHRQGKNHRMRIIAFVGSPIEHEEKEVIYVQKWLYITDI